MTRTLPTGSGADHTASPSVSDCLLFSYLTVVHVCGFTTTSARGQRTTWRVCFSFSRVGPTWEIKPRSLGLGASTVLAPDLSHLALVVVS